MTEFNLRIIGEEKLKLTYAGGRFNWYGQASAMGLVANGGVDQTLTFTGWKLKDSGSGNMTNILSGFTYAVGDFQLAPNFMWQRPLVDPMPNGVAAPGRLRDWINDPFAVRGGNRETTAFEMLFSYDPTPGTWMYEWNNDRAEDAGFAMNLGFVYRKAPYCPRCPHWIFGESYIFCLPKFCPSGGFMGSTFKNCIQTE